MDHQDESEAALARLRCAHCQDLTRMEARKEWKRELKQRLGWWSWLVCFLRS